MTKQSIQSLQFFLTRKTRDPRNRKGNPNVPPKLPRRAGSKWFFRLNLPDPFEIRHQKVGMAEGQTKQEKARPFFLIPNNMKLTKQNTNWLVAAQCSLCFCQLALPSLKFGTKIVQLRSLCPLSSPVIPEATPLGHSSSGYSL